MHQTKKSVHVLSDLSSCLSFGDNGKVAFFKPGTYTCIHNDAYTLYHTDTESWDSEEDIYRVNQKSDNLWDSKRHRPSFGQSHKHTLPSKNACEYTRSVFNTTCIISQLLPCIISSMQAEEWGRSCKMSCRHVIVNFRHTCWSHFTQAEQERSEGSISSCSILTSASPSKRR